MLSIKAGFTSTLQRERQRERERKRGLKLKFCEIKKRLIVNQDQFRPESVIGTNVSRYFSSIGSSEAEAQKHYFICFLIKAMRLS